MSYAPLTIITTITRKVRRWPEIPKGTVELPEPPPLPVAPGFFPFAWAIFLGLYGLFSCVVLLLSRYLLLQIDFLVLYVSGSGLLILSLFVLYCAQYIAKQRTSQQARHQYQQRLQEIEKHLQLLQQQERQARIELSPPLSLSSPWPIAYEQLTITPILNRSFDKQDAQLWARHPGDADFLSLHFGLGQRPASFHIRERPSGQTEPFTDLRLLARELKNRYSSVCVPLTLSLYKKGPVAILGSQQTLQRARAVVQNMVTQLAYHHSPQDVRLILLAPQAQNIAWQWLRALPHTLPFDAITYDAATETQQVRTVALGPYAVNEQLSALARELSRRELLLHDRTSQSYVFGESDTLVQLPHLVIIIDYFESEEEASIRSYPEGMLSPRTPTGQAEASPLQRPELTRALYGGSHLGVSVLCISADQKTIPENSSVILQLNNPQSILLTETTPLPALSKQASEQVTQSAQTDLANQEIQQEIQGEAILYELQPDPPPALICEQLEIYPTAVFHEFARRIQHLRAYPDRRPELRSQIDLRTLLLPSAELTGRDQQILRWQDPTFRIPSFTGRTSPLLRVPIGMKYGDEVQYLDLLKDGPHGLLVGQAGSGKNELLQTLLLSLALVYRPSELTLLLIDQGTGLTLSPFRTLPHTLSYLSPDPSPAQQQRFLTMLHAEIAGRESRLREGKALPHLFILANECLALAEHTKVLLDELLVLATVSRELAIHLLFTTDSPFSRGTNGAMKAQLYRQIRERVHYCLCLRCASAEESRAVIYRDDAVFLPASLPGRTYLLHGNNQLDLFQAAHVTEHIVQESARFIHRAEPSTDKAVATSIVPSAMEA